MDLVKWSGIFTPALLLGVGGALVFPNELGGDLLSPELLLGVVAVGTSIGALTQSVIALVVELVMSTRARARGAQPPTWALTFVTLGGLVLASGALYFVFQTLSMLLMESPALWYATMAMGAGAAGGVFALSCAACTFAILHLLRTRRG